MYIGSALCAESAEVLQELGITHVVNATEVNFRSIFNMNHLVRPYAPCSQPFEAPNHFESDGRVRYLRVPVEDDLQYDFSVFIPNDCAFS